MKKKALDIEITYEAQFFLFLVETHGHVRVPAVLKPMDVVGRVVTLFFGVSGTFQVLAITTNQLTKYPRS